MLAGQKGDYFYIIQQGLFDVVVGGRIVSALEEGKSFGELALLYNTPRAATVRAATSCIVYSLDRDTFRNTLANSSFSKVTHMLLSSFLSVDINTTAAMFSFLSERNNQAVYLPIYLPVCVALTFYFHVYNPVSLSTFTTFAKSTLSFVLYISLSPSLPLSLPPPYTIVMFGCDDRDSLLPRLWVRSLS